MLDVNKINPYIRVAMNSVLKPGKTIKQRVIYDYELIYIDRGSFVLIYNGREYVCDEGSFVFLRPGVRHGFDCRFGELSQPHVHFDMIYGSNSKRTPVSFKDLSDMCEEERVLLQKDIFERYEPFPFVRFEDSNRALTLLRGIIESFSSKKTLLAKGMLSELLYMLINDNFPECFFCDNGKEYDISQQIKDYIDSGQGVGMSLLDFENQFSYSRFYLERCFKARYGMGLIAYKNKKRMELACDLLESESVSQVAKSLSFSSVYAFSRAFKNYFGVSPSDKVRRKI